MTIRPARAWPAISCRSWPSSIPAIQLVVSGHTHNAYICRVPMTGGGTRLLTSAGKYGAMVTDIRLTFDRPGGTLTGEKGEFVIVQGEPIQTPRLTAPLVPSHRVFPADPEVAALVARYREAASGAANRPVGRLGGPGDRRVATAWRARQPD